jgi:hypothetical protein
MQLAADDTPLDQVIAEYEVKLQQQGVPLTDWTAPGLGPEEQDEALDALALRLAPEARIWWEWHNGGPGYGPKKLAAPIGERLLTISEAVDVHREYSEIAQSLVEPDIPALANPDDRWHPSWLPIIGPQLPIVIDCSDPDAPATPVRGINLQYVKESQAIGARSLAQMVRWWIGAIDRGAWRWDTETEKWIVDPYRFAPEFKLSGLA